MTPISIAFVFGVAAGLLAGVVSTKNHYLVEIDKIKSAQLNQELAIANAYNAHIKLEQENYAKNQIIVATAAADAGRVRVRFPARQQCADTAVHAGAQSGPDTPASGAFQRDLGAAFEQFRRDVERDIVSQCDQLNIEVSR